MLGRDISRSEQVETIIPSLKNGFKLTLSNILYALECNFNLISLGQLQESGISYYNYPKCMVLK